MSGFLRLILKDDGIIYLETPNADLLRLCSQNPLLFSLRKKLRKGSSLVPWMHINYFSPKTLKLLLKDTGFKAARFYLQNPRSDRKLKLLLGDWFRGFLFYASIRKINIYFPMTVLAKKVTPDRNSD